MHQWGDGWGHRGLPPGGVTLVMRSSLAGDHIDEFPVELDPTRVYFVAPQVVVAGTDIRYPREGTLLSFVISDPSTMLQPPPSAHLG